MENNNKEKTHISTNLKYLRNINKKSLNEVASICDKSDVAVHYWENGTREPNAVDIAKLSNFYGISVDDLLLKDLRFENNSTYCNTLDDISQKSKVSLEEFLKNIDYNQIEELVKNDDKKEIISYISFYDILTRIYSKTTRERIFLHEYEVYEMFIQATDEAAKDINKINKINQKQSFKASINKENMMLNNDKFNLEAKKDILFTSIKKYYSKDDILREIDKRNVFEIEDSVEGKNVTNEDHRLYIISWFLNRLLKKINKKNINNNQNK